MAYIYNNCNVTIKLFRQLVLTNLKVQGAKTQQFLFGVKYRNSFSYWQEYSFEIFKTIEAD